MPVELALPAAGPELDALLQTLPASPAVFLLHAEGARPYLSKTGDLGRRVRRLLKANDRLKAALNLRGVVSRLEYWPTASRLESALVFYELARTHYPDAYQKLCNLRLPSYVRVLLANDFPRTQVTARLGTRGLSYGPFRSRTAATDFETAVLDLFQVRRCQEDLRPSPEHPGCMYGEMSQCLRPCQAAVTKQEYASEVQRLVEFLASEGRSLSETVEQMRNRFSAEMEFEEAAKQHRRLERIQQVWRLRDELAYEASAANGVAILPSVAPRCAELLFLLKGSWLAPIRFAPEATADKPVSLDRRLKELVLPLVPLDIANSERQEHLAILARWYYSSWRDGEYLAFGRVEELPYRKLVNAVHRVAAGG